MGKSCQSFEESSIKSRRRLLRRRRPKTERRLVLRDEREGAALEGYFGRPRVCVGGGGRGQRGLFLQNGFTSLKGGTAKCSVASLVAPLLLLADVGHGVTSSAVGKWAGRRLEKSTRVMSSFSLLSVKWLSGTFLPFVSLVLLVRGKKLGRCTRLFLHLLSNNRF